MSKETSVKISYGMFISCIVIVLVLCQDLVQVKMRNFFPF